MATVQWLCAVKAALVNSGTRYLNLHGGHSTDNATEADISAPLSSAGQMLGLSVKLSAAPGTGTSYQIQVVINGTPNATLSTTISGSATTGTATGTVSVSAGDLVSLAVTPSGTPTSVAIEAWVEFYPTTTDAFTYPGGFGSNSISSGIGVVRSGLLHGCMTPQSSDSHVNRSLAPFAGQITSLYVSMKTAPGAGTSWTFIIEKNGSEVAASSLVVSGTNKTGNLTGLTISVAAGDYLVFKLKTITGSTASTTGMNFAVTFVPTTAGYFALCGSTNAGSSQVATRFGGPTGAASAGSSVTGWNATEATVSRTAPSALTTVAMAVRMAGAPGGSDGWAYKSRNNVADGNLAISFTGATVSGTDTSHSDSITSGNTFAIKVAPTGVPNGMSDNCWAMGFTGPVGSVPTTGTGAASFPHLTAQGTGSQNFTATGAAAFPHLTAQGTGAEAPRGSGALALPHITAQGSASNLPPTGTSSVLLPHVTAQGSGSELPRASGAIAMPMALMSSPDARAHGGHIGGQHFIGHSRDVFLPMFRMQGTGSRAAPANSGVILMPHLTAQGSGLRNTNGMGAARLPALLMLGGVGAQNPAGTGAILMPHLTLQGSSSLGIGIVTMPMFRTEGYSESPIGVGVGSVTMPMFLVQGHQLAPPSLHIVLLPTGPRLATAYIHSPWWPRQRLAVLATANNIDRSFTAVSRLGTKDTGQGALHISNRDPALQRDSGILTHGNLLVVTSPVALPWVGVLATTSEDDSNGQIELSALSYEAVLDGRITPQTQKFSSSFGANAVFGSLVQEANARNHLGLQMPAILEITNPVDDLETGGQSVLEALNELTGRTSSEWWLDYQVSAQSIKTTLRLGFMQGFDLRDSVHLYQGTHFTAQYKQDMSQAKQQVTTVGDFGADLVDRNSVTRVGAFGPEHLGIASAAIHESTTAAARRLVSLPAGLRNEKINFEVMTGSTAELSRRSQLVQERPLQAERTFNATFYGNVDFRDVAAGNIVSLWGTWGNVTGRHICRVMGLQPDEEMSSAQAALWELVE